MRGRASCWCSDSTSVRGAPAGSALQRRSAVTREPRSNNVEGLALGPNGRRTQRPTFLKGKYEIPAKRQNHNRVFQGAFLTDEENRSWLWPGYIYLSLRGHKEPPQSHPSLTPCSPGLGSLVSGPARTSQVCPSTGHWLCYAPNWSKAAPQRLVPFLLAHKPSCVTGPSLSYGSDRRKWPGEQERPAV